MSHRGRCRCDGRPSMGGRPVRMLSRSDDRAGTRRFGAAGRRRTLSPVRPAGLPRTLREDHHRAGCLFVFALFFTLHLNYVHTAHFGRQSLNMNVWLARGPRGPAARNLRNWGTSSVETLGQVQLELFSNCGRRGGDLCVEPACPVRLPPLSLVRPSRPTWPPHEVFTRG